MQGKVKLLTGDILPQQSGNINVLGADQKVSLILYGMCKNIVRAKASVSDKDRLSRFIIFKAVHQAAECPKFIFLTDRLQLRIKITSAQDIIQRNNMEHVETTFGFTAWRVIGIGIFFI